MTSHIQRVWPGNPYPLGATWDGSGTNFAVFSAHAEKIELCLFDSKGKKEVKRVALPEYTNEIWHGYLPDVEPGQLYAYRAYGPYDPKSGNRFNHHKLLLDPYAKKLKGTLEWNDALFGYIVGHEDEDLSFDKRDSAPYMPKCEVYNSTFTWRQERPSPRSWHETIIYEMHVRGFTMLHPDVPRPARGTLGGLANDKIISYLKNLGVTAVELQPVHTFIHERYLVNKNLSNYWGYNPVCFLSLHPGYLGDNGVNEFKDFVQLLHEEDIEVIMDVVYNHTAEGNQLGPTLSLRGIDNLSYYSLLDGEPRYYNNFAGTGNALELRHPYVLRMVTDSLRYWVNEMRVDGFRFDLSTTLARVNGDFDEHSNFLDSIAQDPVLSAVKLIAEPWDAGEGGYQLGRFPPGWAEWNDRYRDTLRRFWRGDAGQLPELASRLSGSSDIFDQRGRRPWSSINYVAAHDGFTLHDLVSYNDKHNEANLEDNIDGQELNFSWNYGIEGQTTNPEIVSLREKQKRNLLASLFFSQGVPMLMAGDEFGHTKKGNNNAYCQDNEINWLDWGNIDDNGETLTAFVRSLILLRKGHIVFHRQRFFHGKIIPDTMTKDISWYKPDGEEMQVEDWDVETLNTLAFLVSGEAGKYHITEHGEREPDDTFLVLLNATEKTMDYILPEVKNLPSRSLVIDTALDTQVGDTKGKAIDSQFSLKPRSLALIRYSSDEE